MGVGELLGAAVGCGAAAFVGTAALVHYCYKAGVFRRIALATSIVIADAIDTSESNVVQLECVRDVERALTPVPVQPSQDDIGANTRALTFSFNERGSAANESMDDRLISEDVSRVARPSR